MYCFSDILDLVVPAGLVPPVMPGTRFVTVGGAIAADVHGKNHRTRGSISSHIRSFTILIASGDIIECAKDQNADLFWATFGAMGLTGYILKATLELMPIETAFICQESIKTENLADTIQLFEKSHGWEYQVAWLDTGQSGVNLGRSLFSRGRFATLDDLTRAKRKNNPLSRGERIKITAPGFFPSKTHSAAIAQGLQPVFLSQAKGCQKAHNLGHGSIFLSVRQDT